MAVTTEEFWDRVSQSGLFSQSDLASLASTVKAQTAEEVAQELVRLKKLTPFQAKAIYRDSRSPSCWAAMPYWTNSAKGGWEPSIEPSIYQ